MQIFLVGGAVRDELLGIKVKDRDFVVVGCHAKKMLAAGYNQVGKDFPVFLHPHTGEEHALARTERKKGQGYTGFECYAEADVTLEQDLLRRDLTINAIAKTSEGQLIDPYGGQDDLQRRILRHISPAFAEDPLRVLRVARFAARFAHLGFSIAPETLKLMEQLSVNGELSSLTPERVWKETEQALCCQSPQVYFRVLKECQALGVLFPELDKLYGIPGPKRWHPEIDTGKHMLMVMSQAAQLGDSLAMRFACLCHDFGKAVTPREKWPSHHHHGQLGLPIIRAFCERLKVPNDCKELALIVSDLHCQVHNAFKLTNEAILYVFDKADAWRKPERFAQFLIACRADFQGRLGFENRDYHQLDYLDKALSAALEIQVKPIVQAGFKGAEIKGELTRQRLARLKLFIQDWVERTPAL